MNESEKPFSSTIVAPSVSATAYPGVSSSVVDEEIDFGAVNAKSSFEASTLILTVIVLVTVPSTR